MSADQRAVLMDNREYLFGAISKTEDGIVVYPRCHFIIIDGPCPLITEL